MEDFFDGMDRMDGMGGIMFNHNRHNGFHDGHKSIAGLFYPQISQIFCSSTDYVNYTDCFNYINQRNLCNQCNLWIVFNLWIKKSSAFGIFLFIF